MKIYPLHTAIEMNDMALLEFLLQQAVYSPDEVCPLTGKTPLELAATLGQDKAVQLLWQYGASLQTTNANGENLLHWAVQGGNLALLQLGLTVLPANSTDHQGLTPLHWAARFNQLHAMYHLHQAGCLYDVTTSEGLMPIHLAAQYGHLGALTYLHNEGGISYGVTDHQARTLSDIAVAYDQRIIINHLRDVEIRQTGLSPSVSAASQMAITRLLTSAPPLSPPILQLSTCQPVTLDPPLPPISAFFSDWAAPSSTRSSHVNPTPKL